MTCQQISLNAMCIDQTPTQKRGLSVAIWLQVVSVLLALDALEVYECRNRIYVGIAVHKHYT
jgi:hypothetical protein